MIAFFVATENTVAAVEGSEGIGLDVVYDRASSDRLRLREDREDEEWEDGA